MKTNYILALCAVPALVQTAAAEEVSKVDQFGDQTIAILETASTYLDILKTVKEKKATPAEAAKAIRELATTVETIKKGLMELAATMTPEEQAEIQKQLSDPEFVAAIEQIENAMKEVKAALIKREYYGSAELKAACEMYDKASE